MDFSNYLYFCLMFIIFFPVDRQLFQSVYWPSWVNIRTEFSASKYKKPCLKNEIIPETWKRVLTVLVINKCSEKTSHLMARFNIFNLLSPPSPPPPHKFVWNPTDTPDYKPVVTRKKKVKRGLWSWVFQFKWLSNPWVFQHSFCIPFDWGKIEMSSAAGAAMVLLSVATLLVFSMKSPRLHY